MKFDDPVEFIRFVIPEPIRRRFALKFAVVLLVMGASVGVVGLAATEQIKAETQDDVRDEYENVAGQEADIIEQWMTRNRLATQLVSGETSLAADDGLGVTLRNEQAQLPGDVASMHVLRSTLSGTTVVASTSGLSRGASVQRVDRGWTANESFSRTGEVHTSSVYRVDGRPVVGFLSPVAGSDTRLLLVEFRLDGVANSLQGADRATGGFTQVVDRSGTVMIDEPRNESQRLGPDVLQSYSNGTADGPIAAAESFRGGEQDAGVDPRVAGNQHVVEETYTVGYAPVEGTDWVVLVHAPRSEVFAFVNRVQLWGFAATALGVLLIGAVGATMGYSTATAIERLTRRAEQMADGDLDVEISSGREDEIGRLYGAFDDMRDSLNDQITVAENSRKEAERARRETERINTHLEQKAETFSGVMERASEGDLTQRMETDGANESMDRIATEFNRMISELEKTTAQLEGFADEVADSSEVVLASAESVREASESVANSIDRMAEDAGAQRARLETVAEDLESMVEALESVEADHPDLELDETVAGYREVARDVRAATGTSGDLLDEAESVADDAEEQTAALEEVADRVQRLQRHARPLGDILRRFETDPDQEFVFSGGPSQTTDDD